MLSLLDDEKTVFVPVREGVEQSPGVPVLSKLQLDYRSGLNVLMEQATEVFFIHYQVIKGHFREVELLRPEVHEALLKFELRAQQTGLATTVIKSAKYVLCAFLDEAVMQQLGHESSWGQRTLLAQFFNETWGGATVFKVRQLCMENIHEYIDLLEMLFICLCLGFKGQYGALVDGELQLERLKRETYQAIVSFRGERFNQPLSPHGVSLYEGTVTLKKSTSWKIGLALCGGLLLVSYLSMAIFLSIETSPVYDKIIAIVGQK